ncbi:branched-chain amino acid ABC transporter permease [Pimelobacter simplex]|uniref:branched-chain amino acid ABC transporter permease n=1 Tax=Nocardioides simplex TaxID=2045 RepID=UPI0021501C18|nr:branched-chain amino acid ABC transporter permease [Pimelobacter simplex]UUW90810.1 branched-chain amino acid ABC transporter permease [Pimelobacter simplex]UUW94639.1 branched-chain amino acid ABC transporter permease [Pimelobacter simplex]
MILEFLINAVGLGALYALLTIGVALLFGVLGLMNFAYGELILAGAFAMYLFRDQPWPFALLMAIVFAVVVALISERLAFHPLRNADPVTLMIASFAVSLALQSLARMTVLPRTRGVPPERFLSHRVNILGADVSVLDLVTLVLCGVMLLVVAWLMGRTSLGIQLRAAAEDFRMAASLGVKANLVIPAAFVIVGVLSAIGGAVLVARQGSVGADMGLQPMLIGVVGAVLGGMSSLKGAALGGFLLGAATALLESLLPTDLIAFRDAFLFSALIAVLVVRPQGLLSGAKVRVS